jgi:peptidoglycan/LPS O-acetylase OafA/YrhL
MVVLEPVFATIVFSALLAIACLASATHRPTSGASPTAVQEMKGFAILAIVFSHIGYFLASDHRFLFPLSTIAGPGVDLFLIVSGFGLAMSARKSLRTPLDFYKRRFDKLYIPLWIALTLFLVADLLILSKTYAFGTMVSAYLGWFPSADIYADLDSPLWYLSLLIAYYLAFPIVYRPLRPYRSALLLLASGYAMHSALVPLMPAVAHLHELHLWAFPIGVVLAGLLTDHRFPQFESRAARWMLALSLALALSILALYQNIGGSVALAQGISVFTALVIFAFFAIKPFDVRFLALFGTYSYEIYLVHWPILYRYDIFFGFLPAWLALSSYLGLFLSIGWLIQNAQSLSRALRRVA